MTSLLLLLSLLSAPSYTLTAVTLVQPSPRVLKPGETLSLTCTVSSVSITGSYYWSWMRQLPGKQPEWMGYQYSTSRSDYASHLQSRITISTDPSKSQFSLQLRSLTAADTAMYSCARMLGGWSIDYWGQGTMVTVTSASLSAPSLFPLIPSCGLYPDQNPITVGCLAKDFLPESITLSWLNNKDVNMTKGVTSFPSVLTSAGSYTAATQISVSNSDWRVQQPLFCAAEHPQGNRKIKIPAFIANPVMTLHGPTTEDFEGPFRNSTVICQVKDLPTRDITLSWLRNGAPLKSGFSTTGPLLTDEGFLIISELIVTEENWKANVIYTCKVDSRGFSEVRNISKLLICDSPCLSGEIDVQLIPPSFAETYLTKAAKLTCRVINLPTADGLVVTWRRQDGKLLETTIHPRVVQPNGQYHVDATASVCADEWDKGETYICQVTYPDLIFPIEKILRRQPEARSHAPTIYVFPPPSEQLARHETATVTCLVKGFNPPDLFVRWLQNGEPMNASTYITGKPTLESQQSETYFTYSTLTIREQAWNAGNTYTCVVGHQKLPMQVAQKTIDKSTGKPTLVNVSLVLSDTASTCY